MDTKLLQAFLVAGIAGLSLALGGFMALMFRHVKRDVLPLILSFTGGILLYVAFVKFLPAANLQLNEYYPNSYSFQLASVSFFVGLLITVPMDMVLVYYQNKVKRGKRLSRESLQFKEYQLYVLIFLSLTIHNFFEGIATFLSFFSEKVVAIPVILSIIAHNFPEGAVITMIIFKKTRNKQKAILFCLITALAEPLGALGTYLFLHESLIPRDLGIVKAFLAGLLVNTALDELLPGADFKGRHPLSMKGIIAGMLCIGVLLMFVH